MDMANFDVKLFFEKYKKFVVENPLAASEVELALRWISYFAAGRFSQSIVVSELMHSASNILTFVNDAILRKAANIPVHTNEVIRKLQTVLSVIDYAEVFAEVSARRLGGKKTRWSVIVILQLIKTWIRLLLLLKFKQGIQRLPPIPPLNRRVDVPQFCFPERAVAPPGSCQQPNMEVTFTLKRSGRIIRTLEAAPPLCGRTWKLPKPKEMDISQLRNCPPTFLKEIQLAGEVLHITRPLAHLIALGLFGQSSLKPFLLALGMDCTSLGLISHGEKLNYPEKLEMSRRAFLLAIYLLRSPFYDEVMEFPLLLLLRFLSNNVRWVGLILRPLMEYLPEWQRTYFYVWSL